MRIRAQRRARNLTQENLAKRSGLSVSFLGHIERGSRIPSLETVLALALALDLSLDELIQVSFPEKKGKEITFRSLEAIKKELSILERELKKTYD